MHVAKSALMIAVPTACRNLRHHVADARTMATKYPHLFQTSLAVLHISRRREHHRGFTGSGRPSPSEHVAILLHQRKCMHGRSKIARLQLVARKHQPPHAHVSTCTQNARTHTNTHTHTSTQSPDLRAAHASHPAEWRCSNTAHRLRNQPQLHNN